MPILTRLVAQNPCRMSFWLSKTQCIWNQIFSNLCKKRYLWSCYVQQLFQIWTTQAIFNIGSASVLGCLLRRHAQDVSSSCVGTGVRGVMRQECKCCSLSAWCLTPQSWESFYATVGNGPWTCFQHSIFSWFSTSFLGWSFSPGPFLHWTNMDHYLTKYLYSHRTPR